MSRHVVFVATELAPAVPGGAGAVVAELAELLTAGGDRVTVVLVADTAVAAFPWPVVVARPEADDPDGPFLARSRAAATAVARLAAAEPVDLVEFQDFDGLGFWALSHRHELGLEQVPIGVRVHGPVDLMTEAMGTATPELRRAAQMEREAFAMADLVIAPGAAVAELCAARYALDAARLRVGSPPVPELPSAAEWRPAPEPEFVAYGRLAEVKGSHDFLAAALAVAARRPDARFRFVGPDGWSVSAATSMESWLRSQVPSELAGRITFAGAAPRDGVAAALASAWAVVVPSRFETFCLAAHEARRLGLPVVLPDLPAFRGVFSEQTGAAVYDGTVAGLAAVLDRLATDRDYRDRLAGAPAPRTADPAGPYEAPLPAPRHPRSQAGLATAAVHRVAAAAPAAGREERRGRALARRAMRLLPAPLARLAVRVLPQRVKDRFRAVADWRVEAARRSAVRRRAAVTSRIRAGEFGERDDPAVTVVIPCFNQGEYLEDALLSVFEQTLASWEIVVVDDGSTDPATVAVLDALDWPRTRLVRQPNRGLPAARNAGMRVARGAYLVPLDADDEISPEFLATLHAALEPRPGAAYAHCWSELFGDVEATWVARPFNPYLLTTSNSVVGCVLLRAAAWADAGGYDETMRNGNEDWDLWLRLLERGWDQVQVREPLFRYRQHGVSMSVLTEARFEHARTEIAARHPDLYDGDSLRRRKLEWYPWVSLLVDPAGPGGWADQTIDDAEVVPLGPADEEATAACAARGWPLRSPAANVAAAVRAARGKFVLSWPQVAAAAPDTAARLAAALEDAGPEAAAGPDRTTPLLWRRWALVDPGSGLSGTLPVAVGATAAGAGLEQGCCVDEAWTTAGAPPDRPVLRHGPEGEGRLPAWLTR